MAHHHIVIVGGGFGGVTAAAHLAKAKLSDTTVTLVSNKSWLEYYGVLYRLIRGARLGEVCIPLRLMLNDQQTNIVTDTVTSIDPDKKTVTGAHDTYRYDTLILSPGSVTSYFGIPGMQEHSITMKNVAQALGIRRRVETQISTMAEATDQKQKKASGRFIIVGGGPTGIEIAGEIIPLAAKLLNDHGLPSSLVTVDLIEAMDRLLPMAAKSASDRVLKRLQTMGVRVHLNQAVASAEKGIVHFKDGNSIEAGTLIWTAGVEAHPMLKTIPGLELDKRGRVMVDEQLRAKGQPDIMVLGDCAATRYSGMAQTAHADGVFAARVLSTIHKGTSVPMYQPVPPAYAIPAGGLWAAVKFGPLRVYGLAGYIMRRAADIHVYMLILPWRHIPSVFFGMLDLSRYDINPAEATGEAGG